jgi:hypothetical protein
MLLVSLTTICDASAGHETSFAGTGMIGALVDIVICRLQRAAPSHEGPRDGAAVDANVLFSFMRPIGGRRESPFLVREDQNATDRRRVRPVPPDQQKMAHDRFAVIKQECAGSAVGFLPDAIMPLARSGDLFLDVALLCIGI